MSAYAKPVLIRPDGSQSVLERLSFMNEESHALHEAWLQEVLFSNEFCLPIRDIDPSIGPLIPVCRELMTLAGPADILYVSATGKIVIVETKLYRNPEARRSVVAQIIDYAKELAGWTYEDLARQVAIATKKGPNYLLEVARSTSDNFDEALFVDGINRSLSNADMLLLIVGDGITTGTEALVGFLERRGALHFSFGLIEAAIFKFPDGGYLIQPRVLARTEVLKRTLWIRSDGMPIEEVGEERLDAESKDSRTGWFITFWSEYLARLQLDDMKQPLPSGPAKGPNVFLAMPPGRNQCWISAYLMRSRNIGGVYLAFSAAYSAGRSIFEQLYQEKEAIESEVGSVLNWKLAGDSFGVSSNIQFVDLDEPADRHRVLNHLTCMTNKFVNAFRPRLEAFTRE